MNAEPRHRVIIRLYNAWRLCLLGSCIILTVSPIAASAAGDPQLRRLIQTWLECTICDNDKSDPVLKPLIDQGAAAIVPLKTALVEGPSAGDIALLQAYLRTSYKKLNPVIPGEISAPGDEDSFVKMYKDNYDAAYKIRAAQALGAIGAAQTRNSQAAKQAKAALEAGKTRPEPNPRDVDVNEAISEALRNIP